MNLSADFARLKAAGFKNLEESKNIFNPETGNTFGYRLAGLQRVSQFEWERLARLHGSPTTPREYDILYSDKNGYIIASQDDRLACYSEQQRKKSQMYRRLAFMGGGVLIGVIIFVIVQQATKKKKT